MKHSADTYCSGSYSIALGHTLWFLPDGTTRDYARSGGEPRRLCSRCQRYVRLYLCEPPHVEGGVVVYRLMAHRPSRISFGRKVVA